jgi:chemotaxis protein MotA
LIDEGSPQTLRRVLEADLILSEQRDHDAIKFYTSMGGYAPTIGIIGAVMGLIYVMRNLADPSELGAGIAVAFVATIYGVALANLIFLPIANKLTIYINNLSHLKELVIEGSIYVADGENPRSIELKLDGYIM